MREREIRGRASPSKIACVLRAGGVRDAPRAIAHDTARDTPPRGASALLTSAIQSFSTQEKSQFFSSSVSFQPRLRIVS